MCDKSLGMNFETLTGRLVVRGGLETSWSNQVGDWTPFLMAGGLGPRQLQMTGDEKKMEDVERLIPINI
jgi:hypothetical protein